MHDTKSEHDTSVYDDFGESHACPSSTRMLDALSVVTCTFSRAVWTFLFACNPRYDLIHTHVDVNVKNLKSCIIHIWSLVRLYVIIPRQAYEPLNWRYRLYLTMQAFSFFDRGALSGRFFHSRRTHSRCQIKRMGGGNAKFLQGL